MDALDCTRVLIIDTTANQKFLQLVRWPTSNEYCYTCLVLLCIEEILQGVYIPGEPLQRHTRERRPITGIRSSIGLVSPKSMQGVKFTQLKKSLGPLFDILISSITLIMHRATKLTGHQLWRAPIRRFRSSSTVLPRTAHLLHSEFPLVDYKPPLDPDLAWKRLHTSAAEGCPKDFILKRIKLGIDGNPIWSYEKDPNSGEVTEWRGVWPEHGEVLSSEIAANAKMQCTFTDGYPCISSTDDTEGQEQKNPDEAEGWMIKATFVLGCLVCCRVIYDFVQTFRSSRTAGEAVIVPEPGDVAGQSTHEKLTL